MSFQKVNKPGLDLNMHLTVKIRTAIIVQNYKVCQTVLKISEAVN